MTLSGEESQRFFARFSARTGATVLQVSVSLPSFSLDVKESIRYNSYIDETWQRRRMRLCHVSLY